MAHRHGRYPTDEQLSGALPGRLIEEDQTPRKRADTVACSALGTPAIGAHADGNLSGNGLLSAVAFERLSGMGAAGPG